MTENIAITGKSDKTAAIKQCSIKYLESRNKDKALIYNSDNTVSISVKDKKNDDVVVGILGKIPEEVPYLDGVDEKNNYVEDVKDKKGKSKKKVNIKKLIRYNLTQLIPSKAKKGRLEDLKALGIDIPDDVLKDKTLMAKLANGDEDAVEKFIQDNYDGKEGNPTFPLTEEDGIIDLECAERGRVTVDSETYISNVMSDGDGRGENLDFATESFARQRIKEAYDQDHEGYFDNLSSDEKKALMYANLQSEVDKVNNWMKENGYTWHEIDDKATMEKVPTHLHACLRHSGAVSLVKKKYDEDCYESDFQQKVADNALDKAREIRDSQKKTYEEVDKECNHDLKNKDRKKALSDWEKAETRVALLESHASERNSGDKVQKTVSMPI